MSGRLLRYPAPTIGDVVWTRFPNDLYKPHPAPKPRPGLILELRDPAQRGGPWQVAVCPGTSQNLDRIYSHEFSVQRELHPDEFLQTGLSFDTKFDLRRIARLEYTSMWFAPPPHPRFGRIPKLGNLHAASMPRLRAAYLEARK